MKKFLTICLILLLVALGLNGLIFHSNFSLSLYNNKEVKSFIKTDEKNIYIDKGQGFELFEIRGINISNSFPGNSDQLKGPTKEIYLSWFKKIEDLNINTLRVYTILNPEFYKALFEFNQDKKDPLYLIQGVILEDYVDNSSYSAFSKEYKEPFIKDALKTVDVIKGRKKIFFNDRYPNGNYLKDVSPYVLGYIIGVDWNDRTVAFTNNKDDEVKGFNGNYMKTKDGATPFECFLAEVGESVFEYESNKYGTQRLVAFNNYALTDPFDYELMENSIFNKVSKINIEHIALTEKVKSGTFASYHLYPYYPDFYSTDLRYNNYKDESGRINPYEGYIKALNDFHSVPVIVAEYGVPSSRGISNIDPIQGFDQGNLSEKEQGEILLRLYHSIMNAGSSGSIMFTWQDEWNKNSWNTMFGIDTERSGYWLDYQNSNQFFGLLAFDPGKEERLCIVDGDPKEWDKEDQILEEEEMSLSVKQDEEFLYLMAYKKDFDFNQTKLNIPIDTIKDLGSKTANENNLSFDRPADFLLTIDTNKNSKLLVQERYQPIDAMYHLEIYKSDGFESPPAKDSARFIEPTTFIRGYKKYIDKNLPVIEPIVLETGNLVYGNADPKAQDYNSLSDFCVSGDYVEIRLPWQLLNVKDPSQSVIHDDYYEHYGVENKVINEIYLGIGVENQQGIQLKPYELKPWQNKVESHERLKESYNIVKEGFKELK